MDLEFSVVFDETQFAEFVHEEAHTRPGRANHLRQRFLTERSHDRLRLPFLPEIRKQKMNCGDHGPLLYASNHAFIERPGSCDAQWMAIQTSFTEKVAGSEHCDHRFL